MHEDTVTVISVRKDGAGFKADLPGEGEQWLALPDSLKGKAIWKKTYHVGWTKTEKAGRVYYDAKSLNEVASPRAPPSNGEWTPRASESAFITSVMASAYRGMAGKITRAAVRHDIDELRNGYRDIMLGEDAARDYVDNIGDTWEGQ